MGRPRIENKREACSFSLSEDERKLLKNLAESNGISSSTCIALMINETAELGNLPITIGLMKQEIIDSCHKLIKDKNEEIDKAKSQIKVYESILSIIDTVKDRVDELNDKAREQPIIKKKEDVELQNCTAYLTKNKDSMIHYLQKRYVEFPGCTPDERFNAYLLRFRRACYKLYRLGLFSNTEFKELADAIYDMFATNLQSYTIEVGKCLKMESPDFSSSEYYEKNKDFYYETVNKEVQEIKSGKI